MLQAEGVLFFAQSLQESVAYLDPRSFIRPLTGYPAGDLASASSLVFAAPPTSLDAPSSITSLTPGPRPSCAPSRPS